MIVGVDADLAVTGVSIVKAFSLFKGLHSVERKRKRNFLPTGEVRPSEHDYNF